MISTAIETESWSELERIRLAGRLFPIVMLRFEEVDPLRLPVVRQLIREGATIEKISASKAYRKAIREHCAVAFPLFDFNIGLFLALGRAEQGALQPMPDNRYLKRAIHEMKERASRHFGRDPDGEVTL